MSKNCSICLSKRAETVVNSKELVINEERRSYIEIIKFCLGIQISDVPKMNTKLCMKCDQKFVSFYKFKTLALKSLNCMQSLCKDEIKECNKTVKQEQSIENQEVTYYKYDNGIECHTSEYEDATTTTLSKVKNEEDNFDNELVWDLKLSKKCCDSLPDADFDTLAFNNVTNIKKKINHQVKPNQSKTKVCEECGKLVSNLQEHLRSHKLPAIKKFICEQCGRAFASSNGKKKHIKSEHLNIRSICKICGKSVRVLEAHMVTVHNRVDLKHGCKICGAKFRNPYALRRHERIHTGVKLECNLCFKNYSSDYSLECHRRNVHKKEKRHLCQFCSKAFFKRYHLDEHLRSHSDDRSFVCECGKTFKSRSSLALHQRTHDDSGEQYTCDYCYITFPLKKRLAAHIKTHMKLKLYACRFCATRFSRSDHRLRHERTAHLKHMPCPSPKK